MRKQARLACSRFQLVALDTSKLVALSLILVAALQSSCKDTAQDADDAAGDNEMGELLPAGANEETPLDDEDQAAPSRRAETVVQHLRAPDNRPLQQLAVPRGARIGMVARATHTSVADLMALNPELGHEMPPGERRIERIQVPDLAGVDVAAELQVLLNSGDVADLCVEDDFNWGTQRFTDEMRELCLEEQMHKALQ